MKLLVLILLACVVYTSASCGCGPLQRLKVKNQWIQAYSTHSHEREEFGREVWSYLEEHHHGAMKLLERVRGDNLYSPEFQAHIVRVFGGLDICISLLTDEDTLNAQLAHLKVQHNERGIPHEYFDYFLHALQHAIPRHSDAFDQDAWTACYGVISAGITKGLSA